jgi:hypothetical protein
VNKTMGQKHGKGQKMQSVQGFRPAFIVAGQASEAAHPGKIALNDPSAGQQHKAFLGFRQLHNLKTKAVGFGLFLRIIARVALIDKSDFNGLLGHGLHPLTQVTDLIAILLIGQGHDQRQQVAQRIARDVRLASFAPFGPVVSRFSPTFRAGLQRATVQNRGTRLRLASLAQAQDFAHIMNNRFKDTRFQPALSLLVNGVSGRQIVGQHAPGNSTPHDVAHPLNTSRIG